MRSYRPALQTAIRLMMKSFLLLFFKKEVLSLIPL
jgi:hypothetical protein